MQKYRCTYCEYIYDPVSGDPEHNVGRYTPVRRAARRLGMSRLRPGKMGFRCDEGTKNKRHMILYLNLLTSLIMATTDTASSPRFTPQDLPYAYDALAPAISEETMHYHHDKHYAGYVDKLNELIVDTPFAGQPLEDIILSADGPVYNNAAQAWNHAFFFGQLSPKPQKEPSGELLEAINRNFGSLDELKVQIGRAAAGLFGSGWVWLAEDPSGRLAVVSEQNAGNPMRHGMKPLLAIDVWEHAYYIDYRNRRADAVEALWGVVDWKVVGDRYAEK